MTDGTARASAGQPGLRHHLLFMTGSALALLALFSLLRLALLLFNRELLGDASLGTCSKASATACASTCVCSSTSSCRFLWRCSAAGRWPRAGCSASG